MSLRGRDSSSSDYEEHNPKRRRLSDNPDSDYRGETSPGLVGQLEKSISPPPLGRRDASLRHKGSMQSNRGDCRIPSSISLTKIKDLSEDENRDTITLKDILGDPLIKECWQFNYMFDVDFLMSNFDEDVRHLVQVHIIHGYWRTDDPSRQAIQSAAARYENVKVVSAYMPEPFGTHHSKMMVLLRHDNTAQVVIHTANIIERDWENLSQGIWRSELLPLLSETQEVVDELAGQPLQIGELFKEDFLQYLSAYGKSRTGSLTNQVKQYDFRSIRAALVGSVPGRYQYSNPSKSYIDFGSTQKYRKSWGWMGLEHVLSQIPTQNTHPKAPFIVSQVSSIATLDQSGQWLENFHKVLKTSSNPKNSDTKSPNYAIIFPTADEIRESLEGYGSGASIHTKIQSSAQQKQLKYLRPFLCRWSPATTSQEQEPSGTKQEIAEDSYLDAGRTRAVPHIKTYIRWTSKDMLAIDWAILTSANLSTQAWGALPNKDGEVRISSWELGVVVWPDLWSGETNGRGRNVGKNSHGANEDEGTGLKSPEMLPTFKTNHLAIIDSPDTVRVALRVPYDIPLQRYKDKELPWCATADYTAPDWKGRVWVNHG